MTRSDVATTMTGAAILWLTAGLVLPVAATAQEQLATAAADVSEQAPEPLSAEELEILVARIALYPDELIAVISGASLYPLQIVEAARFLDAHEKDKQLHPKESWDGSVVSLLNYPGIVRMMSDDLDWTQALADALAWQQKDVLVAIQQLREEAVANGVIQTDDKVVVETRNDNIVIQSASPEVVYVPRYEPEMLYMSGYAPVPIAYYADPYPNYWYPTATFFAGAVTGAVWAAAVDWDDWGVWGGRWDGADIDIDCNRCLNDIDIDGKVNFNDIDWTKVDRDRISIDKDQFARIGRADIGDRVKVDRDNSIRQRAADIERSNIGAKRTGKAARPADIRKSKLDGGKATAAAKPAARPAVDRQMKRPAAGHREAGAVAKSAKIDRPTGKPKPAAKVDKRPKKPAALGTADRGKAAKVNSNRGHKSMGGGARGGGAHKAVKRPAGRRR